MPIAASIRAAETVTADPAQAEIAQEKLDSLLAPIALYPDQLLTQILMAATYPLDVVHAARFVEANKGLKGDALDQKVAQQDWDPSIQSLTAYPPVLLMMNEKLDWTQQLGDAFLADKKRVMQTVQRLRQKAYAEGNLKSNEQQKVIQQETVIIVEPATPDVVYVPSYNPTVVYGTWWAPAYPPYYYSPPPYYYPPGTVAAAGLIGFGLGVAIANNNHWGWCNSDWHGGDVNIDVNRNNTFVNNRADFKNNVKNGSWQHNAAQRKGVAYGNQRARDQFSKVDRNAVTSRRDARGLDSERGRNNDGTRNDFQNRRDGAGNDRADDRADSKRRDDISQADRERKRDPGRERERGTRNNGRDASSKDLRNFDRSSDARPSFDSSQSRRETKGFSDRGASSRASMGGGRSRGGGGRRR